MDLGYSAPIFVLPVIANRPSNFINLTKTKTNFTIWNFVWLTAALIFAVLIFRTVVFNLADQDTAKHNLLLLSLSLWFILFALQFKAIRQIYVFICWTILSLSLIAMKIWIIKHVNLINSSAETDGTNYLRGLSIPFFVLIFYQLCRQISLKYYNNELSMPSKVFNLIPDENREANWIERINAIGFFTIPFITLYA